MTTRNPIINEMRKYPPANATERVKSALKKATLSGKMSKITVMVPEELHVKIKMVAAKNKTTIRDLIIEYIMSV